MQLYAGERVCSARVCSSVCARDQVCTGTCVRAHVPVSVYVCLHVQDTRMRPCAGALHVWGRVIKQGPLQRKWGTLSRGP